MNKGVRRSSDARDRTGDLRAMNPPTENHKVFDSQTLTNKDKSVFATGFAKVLTASPDLAHIAEAWPSLPEYIKAAIKALVHTHIKGDQK